VLVHEQPTQAGQTESTTRADATQAFWRGKELYESGNFAGAIAQFRLAYAATHEPSLLYDIAQSYRKSGQCLLALENYRAFLGFAPESPLVAQAQKQVSTLAESCKAPAVRSAPVAQADEQAPSTRAPPSNARPKRVTAVAPPKPDERRTTTSASALRVWSVVALSGAVIAGGTAVGLAIWNSGRYADWKANDHSLARGISDGESKQAWYARVQGNDNLAQSIERTDHEAIFLSVSAGALLATAVTLYLAPHSDDPRRSGRATGSETRPQIVLHPRGCVLAGSF
jgi:hypothetical protein